ncbi:hypothetical protein VC83_07296 [Pseudogymnoascus destructans]|uniref:Uncharacterized protein n=1 Tax=Pseudogymnoascus destructans TaxID=655981 RepID=A0A177A2L2_9PEZI|nr:uncharacterized protein VC83_07296 [Pseudogymnoascus destructans]OAF56519.1 hypothetical protein VC83_07296 [Pseudogymnoascus destructans]
MRIPKLFDINTRTRTHTHTQYNSTNPTNPTHTHQTPKTPKPSSCLAALALLPAPAIQDAAAPAADAARSKRFFYGPPLCDAHSTLPIPLRNLSGAARRWQYHT